MTGSAVALTCVRCGATRAMPRARTGQPRTPKGWKQFAAGPHCPRCKHEAAVLRAITLPVSGPVDGTWPEFRLALRRAWTDSTRCANWMTTELYARDMRRQPGETTLAKMPRVYLYPEARVLFPSLSSQSVASLERELQQKYRAQRYELLWTQTRSLASHRYPYPLPIPSQGWSLEQVHQRWQVTFRLGDRRWTVRLRSGPHMRYMTTGLQQLQRGEAVPGALALFRVTAHQSDHRSDGEPATRVMLKIPAWFPRGVREATGILHVRTCAEHFLVAEHHDRTWHLNADHVRRWVVAYDRQRHRLSEDLKSERRRPHRERVGMVARLGRLAEHQRHRLQAWTHEASRHLVNHAVRAQVAALAYDDRERTYLRSYPWEALRLAVQQKAERVGLRFECASDDTTAAAADPLAETTGVTR